MKTKELIESLRNRKKFPAFQAGDSVRVHIRIQEGEKERVQVFEGTVIKRRRKSGPGASFTVRKISYGIGVERIFPVDGPALEKIEVVRKGKVRRGRLFYLRAKKGKAFQVEEASAVRNEDAGIEPEETVESTPSDAKAAPSPEQQTAAVS